MKLLLIEDNLEIIFLAKDLAKRFNISLTLGRNTSDYLLLTKNRKYDFILCDLNLDYDFEGFDIIKFHKKSKNKSKIIAFSSENISPEIFLSNGFDDVLQKQFNHIYSFFEKFSNKSIISSQV